MSLIGDLVGEIIGEMFITNILDSFYGLFDIKKNQKLIFLVGFMGSGKSYLGRKFANKLLMPFCDLDQLIEKEEQQSISEIFASKGEKQFRKKEAQYLRSLRKTKKNVVATGGGTPCFFKNMQWMRKHGITVYLKIEPQVLVERLKKEKDHRPLIQEKTDSELLEFIENKLADRSKYYEQAQITLTRKQISDSKYMENFLDRLKLMD